MKKSLLKLTLVAAFISFATSTFAQYQIPNSNFENWENVSEGNKSGQEPNYWNSFITMQTGSFLYNSARANKVEPSTDVRPGGSSTKSAKIWSTSVLGVVANGNLTTGRIYGGSMSPTDASGNYNYSDPSSNSAFKREFTGKPDSIVGWFKYVPASTSSLARVSAILHENSRYQDPEAKTYSNVVAKAQQNFYATSSKGWQRISAPFTYTSTSKTPALALVSFTTNATPGQGSANDALYIDDVEMIYNSKANSVSFNGSNFTGFNKNTYTYYDIPLTGDAMPTSVTATVDGVSATYTTSIDAANLKATIVVKGGNISENSSNYHTYTFNFVAPKVTVSVSSANSTMGSAYIGSAGTTSVSINKGTSTTVTAVANDGYIFTNWTSNGSVVSTNATYTVGNVNSNTNLVANFAKTYTVEVKANNSNYGNVYINNSNITTITVTEGSSVTIKAVPNEGYKFSSWKKGRNTISTDAEYIITNVTEDIEYSATFTAKVSSNLSFEKEVEYIDIDNGTFVNIASSTNSEGAISYAITESNPANIATIDATTGVVTLNAEGTITVTATQQAWGDYLETSVSYTIDITPTGIEDTDVEWAVIGGDNKIVIEGSDIMQVNIYNLGGTLVKSVTINNSDSIDMNEGLYLVQVVSGKYNKVQKVIVK